ncbi:Glucose-6-phosphate 1-dehydrogenase [Coemansia sp. RSA 1365]|nr:Glucose-6-phosphate 1-dehydrogenase [Coemansia sp. RSA 1365]
MSDTANTSEHVELAAYYSAAAEVNTLAELPVDFFSRATPSQRISGNCTSSDSGNSRSEMEGLRICWQPLKGNISVGRALGDGRSSTVCEGWLQGHRVAFKISATDATAEILDEIHNEVQVYEHLADLQGSVIPRLLDYGLVNIHGRIHAVLALELVQDDKSARCPPQARFAAIDALREIHRRGVVHGDPRIENIIFQRSSAAGRSGLRPRIIDLAFAMVNAPEQAMADDFRGWCEVLKLPPECTRTKSTAHGFTHGVPKRFATTDAPAVKAPSVSSTEKAGVRDADAKFTIEPKPTKKKKKGHKIRNTALLTLLAGSGFVAAAAYAREDREFGQQFEHYVPGARDFMQLMRHHDNSLVMALSDVGYNVYDQAVYTGRFIYQQFGALLNMLQHNSWQAPDDTHKRPKDVQRDTTLSKQKPRSDNVLAAAPVKNMQLEVDIPPLDSDSAAVMELSRRVSDVAAALNKRGLLPEEVQQLKALSDALLALDRHMGTLKDDEKASVEAALDSERKKFDTMLGEFQDTAHAALIAQESQLIEERDGLLKNAANAADERLATELAAQRDFLERRFNRFVRARVDEERGGRLAHLDRVEAQLHQLTRMAHDSRELIHRSRAVARLGVAAAALRNAADAQRPFAAELAALASAATTEFPATRAAATSITRSVAEEGILSQAELEDRFDAVRKEIRSVSLVPENGNFGSQVLSLALSRVMFEKEGLVDGDDVESVLARTSFLLRRHDLDSATRELNQLKGWPKKLAEDWIVAARRKLEVDQAFVVADAEAQLVKLSLV